MGLVQTIELALDQAKKAQVERELSETGKRGGKSFGEGVSQGASPAFASIGNWIKGVGAGIAAAFTVRAVVQFGQELFKLGANAGETASKFTTTFGAASARASEFLATFANKAGLSTERGQDFIATIGAMMQGMGAAKPVSEALGENILSLAGDLTSFHNVPIGETFAALRSGMVGEFEPLRRFGIVLTAADVAERALSNTHKKSKDDLTALEKATAAMQLAQERAGVAVGDLDRTQNSQVNTIRRMSAEWTDVKTRLGEAISAGVEGGDVFGTLGSVVHDLSVWVVANKAEISAWASAIAGFAAKGLRELGALVVNTGREIKVAVDAISWFWRGLQHDFTQAQINMAVAAQQIMGLLLKLETVALKAAEALGFTGMAAKIKDEIARTSTTIGELGTYIATKTVEMAKATDESTRKMTESHTVMGATVSGVQDKVAGAAEAAANRMGTAHSAAAEKAATAWRKTIDDLIEAEAKQAHAVDDDTKKITESVTQSLDQQFERQIQHDLAVTDSRRHATTEQIEMEIAAQQAILKDTSKTSEERAAAFQKLSALQGDLEEMHRQDIAATGRAYHGATQTQTAEGAAAAKTTTEKWLQAGSILTGIFQGLGTTFGGVFKGISGALSSIVGGVGSIASAFDVLSSKGGGLIGTLTKIAGVAGGIGGAIGIIGGVVGAIGGLFHRDKDPGRMRTNDELYNKALNQGDQASLDQLYALSGRRDANTGWGTQAAKDDAWERYKAALAANPTGLNPSGTNERQLSFQMGGLVPWTGRHQLEAGEGVLTIGAMNQLGAGWLAQANAQAQSGQRITTNNAPVFYIDVELRGVADRDVPQRVAAAIQERMGSQYQARAALAGNAALPT